MTPWVIRPFLSPDKRSLFLITYGMFLTPFCAISCGGHDGSISEEREFIRSASLVIREDSPHDTIETSSPMCMKPTGTLRMCAGGPFDSTRKKCWPSAVRGIEFRPVKAEFMRSVCVPCIPFRSAEVPVECPQGVAESHCGDQTSRNA